MPGVGKVQDISPEVASGLQRKMVALYIQMCQINSTLYTTIILHFTFTDYIGF